MTVRLPSPLDPIQQVRDELRKAASECRTFRTVPCQTNREWHAEQYEQWADRLDPALVQPDASLCTTKEHDDTRGDTMGVSKDNPTASKNEVIRP